jgi:hypothetical protein
MMARVFNVSYDLRKPGRSYESLHGELKNSLSWFHVLDSTWLIQTGETADQLSGRLRPRIDANDSILITEVGPDYAGWMPKDVWEWLASRLGAARTF